MCGRWKKAPPAPLEVGKKKKTKARNAEILRILLQKKADGFGARKREEWLDMNWRYVMPGYLQPSLAVIRKVFYEGTAGGEIGASVAETIRQRNEKIYENLTTNPRLVGETITDGSAILEKHWEVLMHGLGPPLTARTIQKIFSQQKKKEESKEVRKQVLKTGMTPDADGPHTKG